MNILHMPRKSVENHHTHACITYMYIVVYNTFKVIFTFKILYVLDKLKNVFADIAYWAIYVQHSIPL